MIGESEEQLQSLLDKVAEESEKKGLKINTKKTFCMVITKYKDIPKCNLLLNGLKITQINQFKYLGSIITSDGKSEKDIITRIGMAKSAFMDLKKILTNKHISITTRLRVLKCYVWSVLLYGSETWTISKKMQKRLEAAEMWFLRRMLKTSWTEKKTNEDILNKMDTSRSLMATILTRQLSFFGHIIRKDGLENMDVQSCA